MNSLIIKKSRASLIHIAVSALIVGIVLTSIKLFFYPGVFFSVLGAAKLFKLIIFVDIVLGPLLTFVVYSDTKKGLKFDLSIIALCQIVAMFYGAHSLYTARPAYSVFVVDRFEVVQVSQLTSQKDPPGIDGPFFDNILVLQARLPDDGEESSKFIEDRMAGGPELAHSVHLYHPIKDASDLLKTAITPLSTIDVNQDHELKNALENKRVEPSSYKRYGLIPFTSTNGDFTALIDLDALSIEYVIDIDPWKYVED